MKRGTTRPEPEPRANDGIGSEIMTLHDVARYLNCHYTTVYRLIQRGGFPVFPLGSDFRVGRADLEEWIVQQHAVSETESPKGTKLRGRPKLKAPEAPAKPKLACKP